MTAMRTITHPGPPIPERITVAPCGFERLTLYLEPGITLQDALSKALASVDGAQAAWLELEDAQVETLTFVVPDHSPDDAHVAWYSPSQTVGSRGRIDRLGIVAGFEGAARFYHGHGLFRDAQGHEVMGHILPLDTRLATRTPVTAWVTRDAQFMRRPDIETGFDLFAVEGGLQNGGPAALVRIAPNIDFTDGINQACAQLGWSRAEVHGLGSLITPHFTDGTILDSFATEILILSGTADLSTPQPHGPDIAAVGIGGEALCKGTVTPNQNAILITAELFLIRTE